MSKNTLYDLTGEYLMLQEMLEDPDVDLEVVQDTLDALDGDIEAKLENCAAVKLQLEGDATMLDKEIKRLQAKKKTVENNVKNLRKYMQLSMEAMGKEKVKTGKFSFTIKASAPKLVIDDEKSVPEQFLIPQPAQIDKKLLLKAVKDAESTDEPILYAHTVVEKSLLIK